MDEFIKILKEINSRLDALERAVSIKNIALPSSGSFVLPSYTSDPASPVNGQMWRNSVSNQIKVFHNGSVRVINTTP